MTINYSNAPKPFGMLILLWLIGWTLRIPVLSIPPIAINIADDIGLNETGLGALTMVPSVAIAFGAIPAAWLISRFSLRKAIVGGLLVMIIASIARGQIDSAFLLFFMSALMGFGITVFQTALPAATRAWTPSHLALGSAVYLNGMMMGELMSAGLTLPLIMPLADNDWRMALILWSTPVLLITIMVIFAKGASAAKEAAAMEQSSGPTLPRLNDRRVWQFSILIGNTIIGFLIINAYAASILRDREELYALEGFIFSFNAMPLLGSFVIMAMPRWVGLRNPIAITGLLGTLGLAGFTFLTGWPSWIAACMTSFSATMMLILLLSIPPLIAKGKAVTRLSAGMTLLGYGIGFALSTLGGWLADSTLNKDMALIPALVFMAMSLLAIGRHKRYPAYH